MKLVRKITDNPLNFFLALSIFISVSGFAVNIITHGYVVEKLMMSDSFLFSDYFYHIAGSSDTEGMYSYGDPFSFPAFAYFLYSFLWSLIPYHSENGILYYRDYMLSGNALVIYVVYSMICMTLLVFTITEYFKKLSPKYTLLMPLAILFSYPVMCTSIQRGNSSLPVGIIIALAVLWMNDSSRVKQEAALVLIAVAFGFKMYPAIFGLFYIKNREPKKLFRLALYCCLAFFIPFLFFGGINGIGNLIHTWTSFVSTGDPQKTNTIWGLFKYATLKLHFSEAVAELIGKVGQYIFFVISIICFFMSKKRWQEVLLLIGILVSFLPSNWQYTSVYYLCATFMFLSETEHFSGNSPLLSWINTVGFALVFSMDWLMVFFRYGVTTGIFGVTYIILLANMIDSFLGFLQVSRTGR